MCSCKCATKHVVTGQRPMPPAEKPLLALEQCSLIQVRPTLNGEEVGEQNRVGRDV